ncbi:MAG: hypothetical protein SGI92_06030 [Bryobacteraceae bacterium]|nr:hypothetical protein [Bryobacteraceae bacterium]
MTSTDAAKLLELPLDASPEQLEARFLELRTKLEGKIAKAPTPGLQAKYRESLALVTTAANTLAKDTGGSLPTTQRRDPTPPPSDSISAQNVGAVRPARQGASNFARGEVFVVAGLALILLVAGAWYWRMTEIEFADRVRLEAEAERQASAVRKQAEEERRRQDNLLAVLRAQMAESETKLETANRTEQEAVRTLNKLRTKERQINQDSAGVPNLEAQALTAQMTAQTAFVSWLRETLPTHPVALSKTKVEDLLSARAVDQAAAAVGVFATELATLLEEISLREPALVAIAEEVRAGPVLAEWRKRIDAVLKADLEVIESSTRSRPDLDSRDYRRIDPDRDVAVHVVKFFEKNPIGIPADLPDAVVWLENMAQQGDNHAMLLMADLHGGHGETVPFDEEKMWMWLDKAAEFGDAEVKYQVATTARYKGGYQRLPWNLGTRVRWLRAAAEAGHAYAQLSLARYGGGVAPEHSLSAEFEETRRQAAAGRFFAQLDLRWLDDVGKLFVSEEEALQWLRKAATQGNPEALQELKARNLTP